MQEENAIEVRNLHIRYKCLHNMSIRRSLFKLRKNKADVFEAVKGISFDVKKGEIVGLVGKNGSGKSTTLRAIAGIFSPDEGTIENYTDSLALLSIGVGFQTRLTGRENIYLSGMLLGYPKDKITEKMDEIISFAEIGKFIDMPVRTYSSGMKMRLGFAININIKPDILVVDEALSVGDADFQKKCRDKINDVIATGVTVLFVSHSRKAIEETCTRAIFLKDGKVQVDGTVEEAFDAYDKKK